MQEKSPSACFNCGRQETETPLVMLQYQGRQACICPQCLPALIHHPEQVASKLADVASSQEE